MLSDYVKNFLFDMDLVCALLQLFFSLPYNLYKTEHHINKLNQTHQLALKKDKHKYH